jgi:hypothetical protein
MTESEVDPDAAALDEVLWDAWKAGRSPPGRTTRSTAPGSSMPDTPGGARAGGFRPPA